MFKSRPSDKVHLVALFLCQIRHIVKCSVSLLAETHPRKAGHPVWLNRVPQCGERWSDRFYTLMYCCFIAGTPMWQWGCRIAQCSTGLMTGIGIKHHQTEPDQAGTVFLYVYVYIYSVYTVCFSGELCCSELPRLCDSPPETQGRAFHLFITTTCQLHLTPTLSYILYIQYMYLYMKHAWHLHNKARVEWRLRVLVFSEKQWFRR